MTSLNYPIDFPTEPGLYECANYPLHKGFLPYRRFPDGTFAEVERDDPDGIVIELDEYHQDRLRESSRGFRAVSL